MALVFFTAILTRLSKIKAQNYKFHLDGGQKFYLHGILEVAL